MRRLAAAFVAVALSVAFSVPSFAADNWLVRSNGKNVQTLWANGAVAVADATRGDPKTDYDQEENRCHSKNHADECRDVTDLGVWTIIASGISSAEYSFLTFRNPENEQEVVQVFFEDDGEVVTMVMEYTYSKVDGTRTETVGATDDYTGPTYTEGRVD